jgi:predicted esterase
MTSPAAPAPSDPAPERADLDERHPIEIRTTGYVRLYVPADLPPGPAPLLMATHGYAQIPEEMFAYARAVAPPHCIVVAPEGPSTFYARQRLPDGTRKRRIAHGWIADEPRQPSERRNRDLLGGALELAAERHPIDPSRTFLVGFSQGVGVATDFFVHEPERVHGMVGLAGGVPAHGRKPLSKLAGRPLLWVCGKEDDSYPPLYMDALMEDFERGGVNVERLVLPVGHYVLEPVQEALSAWLAERM